MLSILFLHTPSKFKMYNMTYQSKLLYHLTLPNTRIRETNGLIELLNFPFSFDAHIFGPICHVTVTTKKYQGILFSPRNIVLRRYGTDMFTMSQSNCMLNKTGFTATKQISVHLSKFPYFKARNI